MMRSSYVFLLSLGCGEVKGLPPDAGVRETVVEAPSVPIRDLDVLFVVDDSNTMLTKQKTLADNFPVFATKLEAIPGGLPNIHLGVVTTDMGTSNSAGPPATAIGQPGNGGCSMTGKSGNLQLGMATGVTGSFLSDIKLDDGTRQQNFNGDLATKFADMAKVGATGCGFEQSLSAMKAALNNNAANAGFIRSTALLAVVFLTDEDDCSVKDPALFGPDAGNNPLTSFRCTRFGVTCNVNGATSGDMNTPNLKDQCHPSTAQDAQLDDITPFHDFLIQLKGDDKHVIVGGIIGDPTPVEVELRAVGGGPQNPALKSSCHNMVNGIDAPADPAVRMQAFLDSFTSHASTTICQNDFSSALQNIGDLVATAVGTPCVGKSLLDIDAATPGLQADCIVEDVLGANVTRLTPCNDNAIPTCWRLVDDATTCPLFDHLRLEVVRTGAPDPNTVTRANCIVP